MDNGFFFAHTKVDNGFKCFTYKNDNQKYYKRQCKNYTHLLFKLTYKSKCTVLYSKTPKISLKSAHLNTPSFSYGRIHSFEQAADIRN